MAISPESLMNLVTVVTAGEQIDTLIKSAPSMNLRDSHCKRESSDAL